MKQFGADEKNDAVVMVGEIGGSMEEEAADIVRGSGHAKPVLAYIAGRTAPPGKPIGHAGAIISRVQGTVKDKREALNSAGIAVAATPAANNTLFREKLKYAAITVNNLFSTDLFPVMANIKPMKKV